MKRVFVAAFLTLLVGGTALAVPRPFEGTLTIDVPGIKTCLGENELPPGWEEFGACGWPLQFQDTVNGIADIVTTGGGQLVSLALPGGAFALAGTHSVTDNYGLGHDIDRYILSIAVDGGGNAAGSFGPGGGVMPLAGVFKYCLFGACPTAAGNVSVPLSVIGTNATATRAFGWGLNLTAFGAPWVTDTITVGVGSSQVHGSHAPGMLNLVTPIVVSTNIGVFPIMQFAYARLTLHFVPEPTTALLLGLGTCALAAIGRSRHR
jgi:hypothetical protein